VKAPMANRVAKAIKLSKERSRTFVERREADFRKMEDNCFSGFRPCTVDDKKDGETVDNDK